MKEFNYNELYKLTTKAVDPYLVSIEEALKSPSNQHLSTAEQSTLVKQMFNRAIRLIAFNFSSQVDEYTNQLTIEEIEKEKKKQTTTVKATPKKATLNQKKTLKELREERAKKANLNKD
jgi:hypothetical protein